MLVYNVSFPITDGILAAALRDGLASWEGLSVVRKLPADTARTRRMITLRNDSGPQEGIQSRRRYGCNVWADNPVDAENLANAAMAVLRGAADGQITALDSFSGPFEIEDEPPFTVGGVELTHFYFAFRIAVRGVAA